MATDSELRGIVLKKYYDARAQPNMIQVPALIDETIDAGTAFRISEQLSQHGLIDWRPIGGIGGQRTGMGRITASGADVVEGTASPPIAIFIQDQSVRISNSPSVQVGNRNIQGVTISGERISIAIDESNASQTEKEEAKSLLQKFLGNRLLASILSTFGWKVG